MAADPFALAGIPTAILQFRDAIILLVVLSYIFASGKIADYLESRNGRITKKELLAAPLSYMIFAAAGVLLYFSTALWVPPQNTIISLGFYLVLMPLGIAIGTGALVLHSFFHKRLNPLQSLDLSMRVILSPLFDGLKGYWTALGAAAILVGISMASYWSSGGNFSLATNDFLLLSVVAALYLFYRALTARDNEGRAGNAVTMLVVLAPSFLRIFFRDLVCAALSLIPFGLFSSCPLDSVGSEWALALSVLSTLVLLIPIIPLIYAVAVNLLRFFTAVEVLLRKEPEAKKE